MATEWELARSAGRCAITGREFAEGEAYFAALFETPAGVERREYAVESWNGPPEGSFCHWRGRMPVREKKAARLEIDPQMLTQLFIGLEDEPSEGKQQFRFVLALLLMRKRLLRFEQAVKTESQEHWQMRLMTDKSLHQVANPKLSEEQVNRLSAQLTALLSGDDIDSLEFSVDGRVEGAGAGEDHAASQCEGEPSRSGDAPNG